MKKIFFKIEDGKRIRMEREYTDTDYLESIAVSNKSIANYIGWILGLTIVSIIVTILALV